MKITIPIFIFTLLITLPFTLFNNSAVAAESFAITDIYGKEHSIANEKGKWVVINYWATWCPPCIKEIPELIKFHKKHKDKDAVVWGINSEEISKVKLVAFSEIMKMTYPVFIAPSTRFTFFGPLNSLPVTYIMTPEGELYKRLVGTITAKGLEKIMRTAP